MTFVVLGDDKRMDYVANHLYCYGYDVVRDLDNKYDDLYIVLPPSAKMDIYDLLKLHFSRIKYIFGGNICQELISGFPDKIHIIDYNIIICSIK